MPNKPKTHYWDGKKYYQQSTGLLLKMACSIMHCVKTDNLRVTMVPEDVTCESCKKKMGGGCVKKDR